MLACLPTHQVWGCSHACEGVLAPYSVITCALLVLCWTPPDLLLLLQCCWRRWGLPAKLIPTAAATASLLLLNDTQTTNTANKGAPTEPATTHPFTCHTFFFWKFLTAPGPSTAPSTSPAHRVLPRTNTPPTAPGPSTALSTSPAHRVLPRTNTHHLRHLDRVLPCQPLQLLQPALVIQLLLRRVLEHLVCSLHPPPPGLPLRLALPPRPPACPPALVR